MCRGSSNFIIVMVISMGTLLSIGSVVMAVVYGLDCLAYIVAVDVRKVSLFLPIVSVHLSLLLLFHFIYCIIADIGIGFTSAAPLKCIGAYFPALLFHKCILTLPVPTAYSGITVLILLGSFLPVLLSLVLLLLCLSVGSQ
jgi:hypothetical protein